MQIAEGGAFQGYFLFGELNFNYTKKLSIEAQHSAFGNVLVSVVHLSSFC
jgi:hypothetical protein